MYLCPICDSCLIKRNERLDEVENPLQQKIQSILIGMKELPLGAILQIHSDFWLVKDIDSWRVMTDDEMVDHD